MRTKRFVGMSLAVVLVLIALGSLYQFNALAGDAGTVVGFKKVPIVWTPVAITQTTYYYGQYGGTTGQDVGFWNNAEAIITADITGTNYLTITPQFSLDGSNWADGQRLSEGWILPLSYSASTVMTIANTSGVTTTTSTITQTTATTFASTAASRSSEWVDYARSLSADGSELFSFPIQGQYLRFKAETFTAGLLITPTIYLMLRNTGGN